MGKPQEQFNPTLGQTDPSVPNMDRNAVVAYCREQLGLEFVTRRTIETATYSRKLRRHLVVGRARWSRADVMAWLQSTREAEYLDRRNMEAS